MNRITTTSNFAFIQENFIKAKTALINETKNGIIDPNRLKGVGLEGASRTGKSWDISVFICHYVTTYRGKQISICRDYLARLKKTFYETFKKVWCDYFFLPRNVFNKVASDIHYNNNTIRFVGVNDDVMIAHGLESDLLIANEAMGIDIESLNQLEQRTREFYIYDYNPSEIESHLYDKELDPSYRLHKTTIFDNPYAPPNAKAKILSYAHPECDDLHIAKKSGYSPKEWIELKNGNVIRKTAHKYNWEVYGLGKRAVGDDVVFTNWQRYTEEPNNDELDWYHIGGDFGFINDPTAVISVKKSGNNLYIRELVYETGLLNNHIANRIIEIGEKDTRSIWDAAEKKSIYELREAGLDAWYSDKGAGSISFGIQKLHQFNIFIHEDSKNLISEFEKYRWARDKNGRYKRNSFGKRIPMDKDNNGIDAVRYVILYYYWHLTEQPIEDIF